MSFEIPTAFVKQFEENVTMLAQQQGSRLRGLTREVDLTGETVFIDQIGPTEAEERTTRHGDSPLISTPHSRRKITPRDYHWGDMIDDQDKLRMLIDPQSEYVMNAAWAMGRRIDRIIFEKFFADASTGKEGGSTVSFPADNVISEDFDGDGTPEGLTVEKLREARKLLLQDEVDLDREQPIIAAPAESIDNLLADPLAISMDFNTVRPLVDGEISSFMGFRFVRTEKVPKLDSDTAQLPVWVPSGMGLAVSQNPTARVAERPDKSFNNYVYYKMTMGASRLEETKVKQIRVAV